MDGVTRHLTMFDAVTIIERIEFELNASGSRSGIVRAPKGITFEDMALGIRADLERTPEPPGLYPELVNAWRRISFTMQATGVDYRQAMAITIRAERAPLAGMKSIFAMELRAHTEFVNAIGAASAQFPDKEWSYEVAAMSRRVRDMVRSVSKRTAAWSVDSPLPHGMAEVLLAATDRACENIIKTT